MRISWIYTIFRIPKYHTLESLYISYTISWSLTFLAEIIIFGVLYRKLARKSSPYETEADYSTAETQ